MNDSIEGKNTREMPPRPPGSTALAPPGPATHANEVTPLAANEKGSSGDEP